MDYQGLIDILEHFREGGQLSDWEMLDVFQIGLDKDGEMRFGLNMALGPVRYRLTSYIPPKGIMLDIHHWLDTTRKL